MANNLADMISCEDSSVSSLRYEKGEGAKTHDENGRNNVVSRSSAFFEKTVIILHHLSRFSPGDRFLIHIDVGRRLLVAAGSLVRCTTVVNGELNFVPWLLTWAQNIISISRFKNEVCRIWKVPILE